MKTDNPVTQRTNRVWYTEAACDIEEFASLVSRTAQLSDYPHARAVEKNVVIYDADSVVEATKSADGRRAVLAEICDVFARGPGVAVFKGAYKDTSVIDKATSVFDAIIVEEKHGKDGGGDH